MNPRWEWFGLILIENSVWKPGFGLVRFHSDCCLGLNQIVSDRFFTVFHQLSYKTFFGLVRNYSHWFGYRYRNESDCLWMNSYPILSPGLSDLAQVWKCPDRLVWKFWSGSDLALVSIPWQESLYMANENFLLQVSKIS